MVLLFLIGLGSCTFSQPSPIDKIRERGELVVLTRNAPTTYYEERDGLAGIEYEMAVDFANYLGVQPRFEVLDSVSAIFDALREGKGDMAAAGLTRTAERNRSYRFGPSYQKVEQQVVCRRNGTLPSGIMDLGGLNIQVIAGSSYVERLGRLKSKYPGLHWTTTETVDTEQLLEQVWSRRIDCTVADSNIVAINRRYFPELVVAFNLTESEPLAWVMSRDSRKLNFAIRDWFKSFRAKGKLDRLLERYYGYIDLFNYVDIRAFNRNTNGLLPRYRSLFETAASRYDIPWTLLAAQAYQESLWDPAATSPTGVRGLMMLTQRTAEGLGVMDRLDPEQSIMGGAKYLSGLYNRIDEIIPEPDRTWMALAAYNVGIGHIRDAQALAVQLEKNPHLWNDLKTVLPLLAQKRYYRNLRHGYARGREPVRYVQRIRHFHDLLDRNVIKTSGFLVPRPKPREL